MRSSIPALAVALVLLGCGNGTSGSSGTAGAGGSGGSAGTGGTPSEADTCAKTCAAEHSFGCAIEANCAATCHDVFTANSDCREELSRYYGCYADHVAALTSCNMPAACVPAFGDYLFCADALCTTSACTDQEGTCSCPATCSGRAVKSVCVGANCTCFVGGAQVGTCTDGTMPICGLKESCCTVLHFLAK
jgi:hypothetical protein